jgi:hypothetical protein
MDINERISKLEKYVLSLEKRILELENRGSNELFWFDETSGLYWELKQNPENLCNFLEAENYIKNLNSNKFGGFDDWRIPVRQELETIFDLEKKEEPYIKSELIKNIPSGAKPIFWSSTEDKERRTLKWVAYFHHGYGDFKYQSQNYFVMAVRKNHDKDAE